MPHGNYLSKTAASMVAVFLLIYWTLPENPIVIDSLTSGGYQYRGAFHVHSIESDGGGTVEEIATAARAADLDFVILTDHGDGTKSIPPRYIGDVLILNGVEISTDSGHYIAIGMTRTPYPLGGDPKGVVEDVRRLGGFGIIAHPYSPREELRWQDFTLPVDAIEWINGDTQWRGSGVMSLLSASVHYWLRPVGSLNSLLYRPTDAINMWDAMASNGPVVGLAGLDAHARLATGTGDEGYTGGLVFRFPWYEDLFRLFGLRVHVDRGQTHDAGIDARNLLASIQSGRFYSSVESQATPPEFMFFGRLPNQTIVEMGGSISGNEDLQLIAKINGPAGAVLRLLQNGTPVVESTNLELAYTAASNDVSAVYRVEGYLSENHEESDLPWIVSNPIFVGSHEPDDTLSAAFRINHIASPTFWRTEQHPDSQVTLNINENGPTMTYTLGNSPTTYAAMVYNMEPGDITSEMSIEFLVRASKPMRISAQLRSAADEERRWRHSFYASQRERRVRLNIRDFAPIGHTNNLDELASRIDSLLFVADTVNYERNSSGEFRVSELVFGQE